MLSWRADTLALYFIVGGKEVEEKKAARSEAKAGCDSVLVDGDGSK
jgi:hypothetical protein